MGLSHNVKLLYPKFSNPAPVTGSKIYRFAAYVPKIGYKTFLAFLHTPFAVAIESGPTSTTNPPPLIADNSEKFFNEKSVKFLEIFIRALFIKIKILFC